MDMDRPTIKGIFVNSHIRALEKELGEDGLVELRKRFGKSIDFKANDDVPVADEVALLEHIVKMTSARSLTQEQVALEAGRLHFRNFTTTPLWNFLSPFFTLNQKFVLLQSARIATMVFQKVIFSADDLATQIVKITLHHNDYPIEHFQGFFEEWIKEANLNGSVEAYRAGDGRFEYTIAWK